MLQDLDTPDILGDTRRLPSNGPDFEMPSWAIEFSAKEQACSLHRYGPCDAAMGVRSSFPKFRIGKKKILCHCSIFTEVKAIQQSDLVFRPDCAGLLDLLDFCFQIPLKSQNISRLRLFCETLVFGQRVCDFKALESLSDDLRSESEDFMTLHAAFLLVYIHNKDEEMSLARIATLLQNSKHPLSPKKERSSSAYGI